MQTPPREPATTRARLDPALFSQPASRWVGTVAALLDEQRELCGRLERLGLEQSGHVGSGHTEGLLRVLAQRQDVLERVVEINEQLEPFRAGREAAMAGLGPDQRESLQRKIDQIADSVDRVRRRDDEDRKRLESQRQAIADELTGLNRLRGAAAAYAGAAGALGGSAGSAAGGVYRGHDQRG